MDIILLLLRVGAYHNCRIANEFSSIVFTYDNFVYNLCYSLVDFIFSII